MWTALLAILAFSLSLLGTFIVRSGVLSSVHAFATDPARGIFILGFLAAVIGRLAGRCLPGAPPGSGMGGRFRAHGRGMHLLAGQQRAAGGRGRLRCCWVPCTPLVIDALGLGKLSVGPPSYFGGVCATDRPGPVPDGCGPLARCGAMPMRPT